MTIPKESPSIRSGIYQIKHLASGKVYVGSSLNLARRLSAHLRALERGDNGCSRLQRAWNKYGASDFVFEVLELVPDTSLLQEREQARMDEARAYDPRRGYNSRLVCNSNRGTKFSATTRRRMSKVFKGRVYESRCREYRVYPPDAAPLIVKNLEAFCRERGLTPGRLNGVANGYKRHYKGWRCEHVDPALWRPVSELKGRGHNRPGAEAHKLAFLARAKRYRVTSPEGVVHEVLGLSRFCESVGLGARAQSNLVAVARGKHLHHKGWTCEYA